MEGGLLAIFASATAFATPVGSEDFNFDQIVVTASRYEKRDLKTAASTEVYTKDDLRNTGAVNVQQALSKATGLLYQSKGPGGVSLGSMTSKISIRAIEKGTLVLVNGTPINWRGLYNLEDIPLDNVDRIEIVKGGGAVLYGSEATGGVINIIMKDALESAVTAGGGNRGRQNYNATTQVGKLGLSYTYDKWGHIGKVSSSITEVSKPTDKEMYNVFDGSEKNDVFLQYKFNERFDILYNHGKSKGKYIYKFGAGYDDALVGEARYDRRHERTKDFVQFNFKDNGWKGNLYYNSNDLQSLGTDFFSSTGATSGYPSRKNDREENLTYGFDMQKLWGKGSDKYLLGTTYQREGFDEYSDGKKKNEYKRNNYSVYASWETEVNKADTFTLSARESWTGGAKDGKNYDNFSAQGQYLHALNENESVYASIGQSFVMPTFKNMYATGSGLVVGNPDLEPQKGVHYEVGWKKNHGDHKWRLALFHYDLEDYIEFKKNKADSKYYPVNEDLKNTGIELSAAVKDDNGWTFNYGVTYNNPQSKSSSSLGTVKNYWDRNFGRWILNGSATYQEGPWTMSLTANYLADRVLTPSTGPSKETKPYLLTTLNINYVLDAANELNLSVDNVLDRRDNVNHTSSAYYSAPVNFLLSYKHKF